MNTLRRQLQACTWLALVAMLALALLPTMSHALAFAQGSQSARAEVCTPQGMKLVALSDAADADSTATQPVQLDHCPYCCLGASAQGMPPGPGLTLHPPPSAALVPAVSLQAPRTLLAWRSTQPRGPPLIS